MATCGLKQEAALLHQDLEKKAKFLIANACITRLCNIRQIFSTSCKWEHKFSWRWLSYSGDCLGFHQGHYLEKAPALVVKEAATQRFVPWIPVAPIKTEKRDPWFGESSSCFMHPIRSQYLDSWVFCDWLNLDRWSLFLQDNVLAPLQIAVRSYGIRWYALRPDYSQGPLQSLHVASKFAIFVCL